MIACRYHIRSLTGCAIGVLLCKQNGLALLPEASGYCTLTMSCALAGGCKEQILQWISEGKFDVSSLPVEVWPVSACAEAYKYQLDKGADVFKILFDWSK